ncbi:MAG: class I SAM-dependent methyltransferase [Dehalococcoidia bacterium]|nr:class I SAM-dependent methyltransferase [Dehalococcoidia bacterium]
MAKVEPFEKHASEYEDWFTKHKFVYQSELEAVRQHLPQNKQGIEVGVGSGRFAAPLGIKFGLEPSAKMREIAQKRGVKVVGGVAEAIPFSDSILDFALMVTTICFVDDLEASFKEAHRILKPGGCLIIGFIDQDSPIGQFYKRHKENSVFYREATFYSVADVVPILNKAGFGDLAFSQTIFKNLSDIDRLEPVKSGYGEGSFVVIKAIK